MKIKYLLIVILFWGCKKGGGASPTPTPTSSVKDPTIKLVTVNENVLDNLMYNVNTLPIIKVIFTEPILASSIANAVQLTDANGLSIAITNTQLNNDSILLINVNNPLPYLTKFNLKINPTLKSASNGNLSTMLDKYIVTKIDSTDKFNLINDNALMNIVQAQTFKYFWDYGHPISGLARERSNGDDNVITTGGSGFGIMSLVVATNRNFITRSQAITRLQTIVAFLKNTTQKFHGAFPHWLNGTSGVVIPFSTKDNGADLVETSYLMAGLLTARQYFNGTDATETALRNDINTLWNNVEWDWFRQNNQNVLYWHWSPNYNWDMNVKIQGWNECLITYVLAASSISHSIPKMVYDNCWAQNGAFKNNNNYLGFSLPLGSAYGGPLFFSHYSFLGINPNGLNDVYANYQTQTINHSKINYAYCSSNPNNNFGYSNLCWGLTASDIQNGYSASSPTNDVGVIAPTAAISSMPYTPTESMQALKFYYYKLGDKLFKTYGFIDAFSLKDQWFANSFLAIDQGPIIVMIENYRTGLIWNLFTSCPEVKTGMLNLGFTAPYL